jgi:hypothetical protein
MRSIFLDLIPFPFPHTSENLSKTILESVSDWGIDNKLLAITSDGAANMIAACRILIEKSLILFNNRCSAHSIQLIVNAGLS